MAKGWRDELVQLAGAEIVREALDENAVGSHVEAIDAVLEAWEDAQDAPVAQATVDALVEAAEKRDADGVPLVEDVAERPEWRETVGEEVAEAMLAEGHDDGVPAWREEVGEATAAAMLGEAA